MARGAGGCRLQITPLPPSSPLERRRCWSVVGTPDSMMSRRGSVVSPMG